MLDPGEVALAIVGISAIIDDEMPRWTLERQRELEKYEDTIIEMTDKAVKGTKPPKIKRKHDYRKTLDRLSRPLPQSGIDKIVRAFPADQADLAGEFLAFVQNIWQHLKEIFPISEYTTLLGSKNLQPTGDKTWQFFNRLSVLNDPLVAIQMIGSGSMLKGEAKVFKEFFPSISQTITTEIYNSISRATAKAPAKGYRLPERPKVGLQNWLDRRSVDYSPSKPPMPTPTTDARESSQGKKPALELSPTETITDAQQTRAGA